LSWPAAMSIGRDLVPAIAGEDCLRKGFGSNRAHLEEHGKPVAFYSDKHAIFSDKHAIFRVNSEDAAGGDDATQSRCALLALIIDTLCASSPRANSPPLRRHTSPDDE
jgi:hypothetical protein